MMTQAETRPPHVELLFTREQVQDTINSLADQLIGQYAEANPLFVCFLKGGVPFTVQLMQAIATRSAEQDSTFHPEVDYMIVSTYGSGTEAKEPRLVVDLSNKTAVNGRHVIMVDDVLDTGTTLAFTENHLRSLGAQQVDSIVLVQKTGQPRPVYPAATLHGFESPYGQWLVGMGMNGDPRYPEPEAGRWLGHIATVTTEM